MEGLGLFGLLLPAAGGSAGGSQGATDTPGASRCSATGGGGPSSVTSPMRSVVNMALEPMEVRDGRAGKGEGGREEAGAARRSTNCGRTVALRLSPPFAMPAAFAFRRERA